MKANKKLRNKKQISEKSTNKKVSKETEIAVVATMSSGKSTIINALIEDNILPSKNMACTAKIYELKHNEREGYFIESFNENGTPIFSTELDRNSNNEIKDGLIVCNSNKEIHKISITGNFPSIDNTTIIDTPGPDNSQDLDHRDKTLNIIKSLKDKYIFFIIDATKYGVRDEDELLKTTVKSVMKFNKEDKITFVVNKADDYKKSEFRDFLELKKNLRERLVKMDVGITHPKIVFTSGKTMLLEILKKKNGLDEDSADDLELFVKKVHNDRNDFYKYSDIDENIKNTIEKNIRDAININDEYKLVLNASGINIIRIMIQNIANGAERNKSEINKTYTNKDKFSEVDKSTLNRDKNREEKKGKNKVQHKLKNIEIIITCNPYKKINSFKDSKGNDLSKNTNLSKYTTDKRLEEFVSELPSDITKILNEKEIKIVFNGTIYDYKELEIVVKKYNEMESTMCKLDIEPGRLIDGNHIKQTMHRIKELIKDIDSNNISELRDEETLLLNKSVLDSEVKVAVVATMSSGKSTLINSMLGRDLMPSKNMACTAKLTNIYNVKNDNCVVEVLDSKGKVKKRLTNPSKDKLEDINDDKNSGDMKMWVDIPAIKSDENKLVLIDTPGPDNAQDDSHRQKTYDLIKEGQSDSKNMILFIFDGTKFGVNDENNLLKTIAAESNRDGTIDRDRFIFVINKMDDYKADELEELKNTVITRLNNFGIYSPKVHFISANMAKLARMESLGQELDLDDEDKLCMIKRRAERNGYDFYKYSELTPTIEKQLQERINKSIEKKNYLELAMHYSGVTALELTIDEFLNNHKTVNNINLIYSNYNKKIANLNILGELEKELEQIRDKVSQEKVTEREKIAYINDEKIQVDKMINQIQQLRKKLKNNATIEKKIAIISPANAVEKVKKLRIDQINYIKAFIDIAENGISINSTTRKEKNSSGALEEFYNNVTKFNGIKEDYLSNFLTILEKDLKDRNAEINSEFKRIVNEDIVNQFKIIFEEYKKVVESELKGFDFSSDINKFIQNSSIDFKTFNENNLKNNMDSKYKTVREKNSERDGFFGFFKVWKPRYVEVNKLDYKYVSSSVFIEGFTIIYKQFDKLFMDIEKEFKYDFEQRKGSMTSQMNKVVADTDKNITKLEENCRLKNENLNRIYGDLSKVNSSLKSNTNKVEKLKKEVAVASIKQHKASEIEQRLNNIIEF